MKIQQYLPNGEIAEFDSLAPIVEALQARREWLASLPHTALLELFDDFGKQLLADPATWRLEGVAFLAMWLRANNLRKVLELNTGGHPACLDGFVERNGVKIAARPRGLVSMWLAGNVSTLPLFSLIPALLAKNVCLAKLATPDPAIGMLLGVLRRCHGGGIDGEELVQALAVVWFDYRETALNEAMSLAADARIFWGGAEALRVVTALPRQEHCTELIFGPKYSIGVIDRELAGDAAKLATAVAGFVRDIAAFDQRACSAPQTIFLERNPHVSLRALGELFAGQLAKLPAKDGLDAYTTLRIAQTRAAWALDEARDVFASGPEANWTVCMDREVSLKEAVQSRTIFLTEVEEWKQLLPLISPKVQTVGAAFADPAQAEDFAYAATIRGVARCVRPGLMNGHESPWDGKLVISELVRWVTLKG